jgi:hypothetical protein
MSTLKGGNGVGGSQGLKRRNSSIGSFLDFVENNDEDDDVSSERRGSGYNNS